MVQKWRKHIRASRVIKGIFCYCIYAMIQFRYSFPSNNISTYHGSTISKNILLQYRIKKNFDSGTILIFSVMFRFMSIREILWCWVTFKIQKICKCVPYNISGNYLKTKENGLFIQYLRLIQPSGKNALKYYLFSSFPLISYRNNVYFSL